MPNDLLTATQPGEGALDVKPTYGLPAGTPLMNIRGRVDASGETVYRDVTPQRSGFQAQPGSQPSAQDLIDSAIQGRREHEARRQYLINQLPNANRRTAAAITAQLHSIDSDERALEREANERRISAHESASEMEKRLKTDRETEIDEQAGALMNSLGQLDAMKRKGQITKDEYDSALIGYGSRYSLGTRHPGAGKMLEHFLTEANKENDLRPHQELSEASKIATKYGIPIQNDPNTGLPSVEHTQNAAMKTDKGRAETLHQLNQEMFNKYGIGTGVSSLFNPIKEHTSDDKGKSINLPYADPKTGKTNQVTVPTKLFNQMKEDFGARYSEATAPVQATPTTPAKPSADQYISGKQYRDSQGNTATYLGNGKWQQ
jgi:hypothetical protein